MPVQGSAPEAVVEAVAAVAAAVVEGEVAAVVEGAVVATWSS
jgi:hypothetical protein